MIFRRINRLCVGLVVVAGATLVLATGTARAQQEAECSITNFPTINDETVVVDLTPTQFVSAQSAINAFGWLLDHPTDPLVTFESFLTDDFTYEACTANNTQIATRGNLEAFKTYLSSEVFELLRSGHLRSRHFLSNTVFLEGENAGEVRAIVAMIVTIQTPVFETPFLDYNATLLMTLAERPDGRFALDRVIMRTDEDTQVDISRAR